MARWKVTDRFLPRSRKRWASVSGLLLAAAVARIAAASPVASDSAGTVTVEIHNDMPHLQFTILRDSRWGDASVGEPVWQCNDGCVAALPPGRYRLKTVGLLGSNVGEYETALKLGGDVDVRVIPPSHTARVVGLVAGIAGSVVAMGAGFVLFAGALGATTGDCDASADCHRLTRKELIWGGILAGVTLTGAGVAAVGFTSFAHNGGPRITVAPQRHRKDTTQGVSLGPIRTGSGWGLGVAKSF